MLFPIIYRFFLLLAYLTLLWYVELWVEACVLSHCLLLCHFCIDCLGQPSYIVTYFFEIGKSFLKILQIFTNSFWHSNLIKKASSKDRSNKNKPSMQNFYAKLLCKTSVQNMKDFTFLTFFIKRYKVICF